MAFDLPQPNPPGDVPEDVFAVEVIGGAMIPPGTTLLCDRRTPTAGDTVIVHHHDGVGMVTATVCELHQDADGWWAVAGSNERMALTLDPAEAMRAATLDGLSIAGTVYATYAPVRAGAYAETEQEAAAR